MGVTTHHVIVVTSFDQQRVFRAYNKALELGMQVTQIVTSPLNGYHTFVVTPDGSKNGWAESNDGNAAREKFIDWIREGAHGDGSNSTSYVEVRYADEYARCTKVVNSSDDDRLAHRVRQIR